MEKIEEACRRFTIDKLEALLAITSSAEAVVDTTTISGALNKVGQELGGTLSSLSRTKINGEPLVLPVGRSFGEGTLWRINEKIAPKEIINGLVKTILQENKEYRIASKEDQ